MNLKSVLLACISIISISSIRSQANIYPAIQTKLDAFIQYSNANEWDKAFDLLYPKLFAKVPKEEIVNQMNATDTSGMSMRISNTKVTAGSAPVTEGTETFVRVEYTSDVTVQITHKGIYDYPKSIQAMDQQFKATYGDANVQFDHQAKKFVIKAYKVMMAIDGGDGDWKLVEVNMDQPALMEFLFPRSILNTLLRVE